MWGSTHLTSGRAGRKQKFCTTTTPNTDHRPGWWRDIAGRRNCLQKRTTHTHAEIYFATQTGSGPCEIISQTRRDMIAGTSVGCCSNFLSKDQPAGRPDPGSRGSCLAAVNRRACDCLWVALVVGGFKFLWGFFFFGTFLKGTLDGGIKDEERWKEIDSVTP